jgi:G3E family GTPase
MSGATGANADADNDAHTPPALIPLTVPDPMHDPPSDTTILSSPTTTLSPACLAPRLPVPMTILTGWLGAGKTTLLTHLVRYCATKAFKVAVIQNEVSALGVEAPMRLSDDSGAFGEILELGHGCVCCSVRTDFITAVEALLKKRPFDYIVLECSGLADPGELVRMLWVDSELESRVYLDGIIGLADCRYLAGHLDHNGIDDDDIDEGNDGGNDHDSQRKAARQPVGESSQVMNQLAFADCIVLNKTDLVTSVELAVLTARVHRLNSAATLLPAVRSCVDMRRILNIRAFDGHATAAAATAGDSATGAIGAASAVSAVGAVSAVSAVTAVSAASAGGEADCGLLGPSSSSSSSLSLLPPAGPLCLSLLEKNKKEKKLRMDRHIHTHDYSIRTAVLTAPDGRRVHLQRLKDWLAILLWADAPSKSGGGASGDASAGMTTGTLTTSSPGGRPPAWRKTASGATRIFRIKAILAVCDDARQMFLQGVQELYDIEAGAVWPPGVLRITRMVVIGRHLDSDALQRDFQQCLVPHCG